MSRKKTIFITGSNRGIGNAILHKSAQEGYNIFAHTRAKSDAFISDLENLKAKYNVQIFPIYFDLTDYESMKETIKNIIKGKYEINALVNCAGIGYGGYFQMTPISKYKEVFNVNFFSWLELTQMILKIMVKQKEGSIVNLASLSARELEAGTSAYSASKSAIIAWTRILAKEVGSLGIRVNAIAPGIVDTDMGKLNSEEKKEKIMKFNPMKRLIKPEEIADLTMFLLSDKASYINGETVFVDGGGYNLNGNCNWRIFLNDFNNTLFDERVCA